MQTQRTWTSLKRIALEHFKLLRIQQPRWHCEDLLLSLELSPTALLHELAGLAGFKSRAEPSVQEVCAVAGKWMHGVSSPEAIASETNLPVERVHQILDFAQSGYGTSRYGEAPYGGNRKYSDGKSSVPRRVTVKGQLTYRGHTYTLGTAYRGRTVLLQER